MMETNLFAASCNVSTKSNGHPVEQLYEGDGTEAQAQTKQSSYLGHEVNHAHVLRSSVLCETFLG